MSTCVVQCIGYRFVFQNPDDKSEQHTVVTEPLTSETALKFMQQIKQMEGLDDVEKGLVFTIDYRVFINGYDFDGLSNLTVMPTDDPSEVLVIGSYKSIIQLGPNTYGGSGNVIKTRIKVKVADILNCHPNLVLL